MATQLQTKTVDGKTIYLIRPTRNILRSLEELYKPSADAERMGLLIGDPGIGKTTAGEIFAGDHEDVCYIDLPPRSAMLSPAAPLRLLERSLGTASSARDVMGRLDDITEALRRRPRMILLDTAHRLRYDHIDVFRYCHDRARVPVVFLSVPALLPMFDQHREFGSRLALRMRLLAATREEIIELLGDYPEEVAADIYQRTGGRIREVLQLDRLVRSSNKSPDHMTIKRIQEIAKVYLAA